MQTAILAGKAKILLCKPMLFLITITVIFGHLYLCFMQAKENQDCKKYGYSEESCLLFGGEGRILNRRVQTHYGYSKHVKTKNTKVEIKTFLNTLRVDT